MISTSGMSAVVRELWRYAVPRLRPNERMALSEPYALIHDVEDAYRICAFRITTDARGTRTRRYQVASVDIPGRKLRAQRTKTEVVNVVREALHVLVGRLRDRLPEGWRLLGRRRAPAVKRTRLWRSKR